MSEKKQFDLPDECWELIFRSLHHRYYRSISSVCKRFLSITNGLHSSLAIIDPTILFLPRLFLRFPAIKSIDLSHFLGDLNPILRLISRSALDLDFLDVSNSRNDLLVDGFRELGSTMRNLRVLRYSKAGFLSDHCLLVIADCFSSLQELDISFPNGNCEIIQITDTVSDFGIRTLATALKDLRKVNLSGNRFITDASLLSLCNNCEFLSEIAIQECDFITLVGISSAIRQRPTLCSISLSSIGSRRNNQGPIINSLMSLKGLTAIDLSASSVSDKLLCSLAEQGFPLKKLILKYCQKFTYTGISCLLSKCQSVQYLDLLNNEVLTDYDMKNLSLFLPNLTFINLSGSSQLSNSTFLTLARRCPLLNEIRMERTRLGLNFGQGDNFTDLIVNSQMKTLHLGNNSALKDEDVERFASICPNLEFLDLNACPGISEKGVAEVLKTCYKIRHLNLTFCLNVGVFDEIEFHFLSPNLEVLNLSLTRIGDESLSVISKSCCGLTHLDLQNCPKVTENGVKEVVRKCTRLIEIDLKGCTNVRADLVYWMVFSRPSLRKLVAPPCFVSSPGQKQLLWHHGCLVCLESLEIPERLF